MPRGRVGAPQRRDLSWLNAPLARGTFNRRMPRSSPTPTEAQRAALLRFEALYEEWRVADLRLLEAEQELLAASFKAKGGEVPQELAERVARLRAIAEEAQRMTFAARDEANGA